MSRIANLKKLSKILDKEPKLIEVQKTRTIFVGDTHGDFDATQKIVENYFRPGTKLVFLGDYVDRGENSQQNIDYLIELKIEHPQSVFLLVGNHEGYAKLPFLPAEWWQELKPSLKQEYSLVFDKLPLAFSISEILALHGGLPEVKNLKAINKIKPGSKPWFWILWGDFKEIPGGYLGPDPLTNRPLFGRNHFFDLMERFKKTVLIRSHQPDAPQLMFDNRCLTIFSSSIYRQERRIAIFDPAQKINTAKDLKILTL